MIHTHTHTRTNTHTHTHTHTHKHTHTHTQVAADREGLAGAAEGAQHHDAAEPGGYVLWSAWHACLRAAAWPS